MVPPVRKNTLFLKSEIFHIYVYYIVFGSEMHAEYEYYV